jgi:hypothetical protein
MFVNRGIYDKGWTAVTRHSTPWAFAAELPAFDDDVWELYAPDDWTQARDLSSEQPERLHELQRLFLIEAVKYDVLPLDDRRVERLNADLAGRPQLIRGNSQLLFSGMGRLTENSIIVLKNKSHAVTAQIVVPEAGAHGVIIAQGGSFGGWSLYAKDGTPVYCYNLFGLQRFKVAATVRSRPASTRSGWSSPTTAADSPRAAPRLSTSTAPKSARAASTRPSRCSSPATRPRISGATAPPRSATTTDRATAGSPAECVGCSSTSTKPPRTSTT